MVGKIKVSDWSVVKRMAISMGVEAGKDSGRYRYILKNDTGSIRFQSFGGMSMYLVQRNSGSISAKKMQEDLKSNAKMGF